MIYRDYRYYLFCFCFCFLFFFSPVTMSSATHGSTPLGVGAARLTTRHRCMCSAGGVAQASSGAVDCGHVCIPCYIVQVRGANFQPQQITVPPRSRPPCTPSLVFSSLFLSLSPSSFLILPHSPVRLPDATPLASHRTTRRDAYNVFA